VTLTGLLLLIDAGPAGSAEPRDVYETTIAADSPVAMYRFEDSIGSGTLADSAGSDTATSNGTVLGGEGPFGGSGSGSFGGEAYASLSSDPLESASEFTAEAWVYWDGSSYDEPIFDFGSSSTNHLYLTPAASAGGHDLLLELHAGESESAQVTAPALAGDAWHYLAVTESGAGDLTLYVDGTEVGHTAEAALESSSLGSIPTAYLGKSLAGGPSFRGRLSNVAFYNKALSSTAIKAHYDAAEFPVNTEPPTISGTLEDGSTLSAEAGVWTGVAPITFGYQWRRCNGSGETCSDVSGATNSTYEASFEDLGHRLRVLLTATNGAGSSDDASAASAFVAPTPLTEYGFASEFGEEGSGDGQFKEPFDVAVGTGGEMFVLDRSNDRVERFNEAGEYLGQFGEEGSGDGELRAPDALALDSNGNVFVLDTGNERVEEFDNSGVFIRAFGAGLEGAGAEGIAVDHQDRIWVSVLGEQDHLVVFSGEGEHLKDVGSRGSGPGEFREPEGLTVDAQGHIWAVDYNGRVEEFDETGEYLAQFGSEGAAAGQLGGSYGIAVDGEHVFLSEWWTSRVQEFDEAGGFIAQLGAPGTETGELGFPAGLAVTPAHDLLITDLTNNRIEKWSPEAPGAPVNVATPSIVGTPGVGSVLAAGAGVWRGSPRRIYTYQWQRCDEHGEECADVVGATGTSYTALNEDLNSTLRVVVTATNSHGSASSPSSPSESIGAPPANTSPPTISGTAEEGQELTADLGVWENEGGSFIQWRRCDEHGEECSDLEAYGEGYTATAEDIGHTLRVKVFEWNSAGETSATSAATAVVTGPTAPVDLSAPTVSGTAQDGETLTAAHGGWGGAQPITYTYQWQRCDESGAECTDIEGATGTSYKPDASDIGATMRVRVTATNSLGSEAAVSSATAVVTPPFPPTSLAAPQISGTPEQSRTLTASEGEWEGAEPMSYAYQWRRCNTSGAECADVEGATSATFKLGAEDVGATMRVRVTATNAGGSTSSISPQTPVVKPLAPANLEAPTISGTTTDGNTLTAGNGSWSGTLPLSYAYQWRRCNGSGRSCNSIPGTTSSTYVLNSADVGGTLRVRVTASNLAGSATSTSAASSVVASVAPTDGSAPTITGVARDGQTLTAGNGEWTGTTPISYSYQWQRCNAMGEACADVGGAVVATYHLSPDDIGYRLRAVVTATNVGGAVASDSSPSSVVEGAAPANTAEPTIAGVSREGATLTASVGSWTGTPTISYANHWQSCSSLGLGCMDLTGAVSASYTLAAADVGTTVRVRVTATNELGSSEAVSKVSGVVTDAAGTPPTGHVDQLPFASATVIASGTGEQAGSGFAAATLEVSGAGESTWESLCGPLTPDVVGNFSCPWSTAGAYPDGAYELRARLDDGSSPAVSYTTAPVEVIVDNTDPSGSVSSLSYLRGSTAIGGGAGDSGSGVASWQLQIDAGSGWQSACDGQSQPVSPGHYACSLSTGRLGDGEHAFRAIVSDRAGNRYITPLVHGTIDNAPPAGSLSAIAGAGDLEGEISLEGSAGDEGSGVASWTAQVSPANGGPWSDVCPPRTAPESGEIYECSWDTAAFADGGYRVRARIVDHAGNVRTTGIRSVTVDNGGGTEEPGSPGSSCITFWTGGSGGAWGTPANWSTGKVPGPHDRACIPHGTTATVEGSSWEVGALDGSGTLRLAGGTLALSDRASQSEVGILEASGGTLTIAGTLVVADSLSWTGGTLGGAGTLRLAPASSGTIAAALGGAVTLDRGALVNDGSLTLEEGRIAMSADAEIKNAGNLDVRSEDGGLLGGAIFDADGSEPWLDNTGMLVKSTGGGETIVGVALENDGEIDAETGSLVLASGGKPGRSASGGWTAASGASIHLAGGAFTLGDVPVSGTLAVDGGAVSVAGIEGTEAKLVLAGGSLALASEATVDSFEQSGGTLETGTLEAAYLNVASEFSWSGGEMAFESRTVIEEGAVGQIAAGSGGQVTLDGAVLINRGTLTWEDGAIVVEATAAIENAGTFQANAEDAEDPGFGIVAGDSSNLLIQNDGRFEKASGAGVTRVQVPFENNGEVLARSGRLEFSGGGGLGEFGAPGSWATESGGLIALTGGTFLIDATVDLEDVQVEGATVINDSTPPTGSISVPPRLVGSSEITGVAEDADSGVFKWELEISPEGEEAWHEACPVQYFPLGENEYGCELDAGTYPPGHYQLRALITDRAGNAYTTSVAETEIDNVPFNLTLPSTSGPTAQGRALSAHPGAWAGEQPISYEYEWQSCSAEGAECEAIEGATRPSYIPGAEQVGHKLRLVVTAINEAGSSSATSATTAVIAAAMEETVAPSVSGTVEDGQTLTATAGTWSAPSAITYQYQWQVCDSVGAHCEDLEGETSATYAIESFTVGRSLRVRVTATDASESLTAASAATAAVAPAAPSNSQPPSVVGHMNVGQTLSAEPGEWTGTDVEFGYQWQRCDVHGESCVDIADATEAEYLVAGADVGATLMVVVTASNEISSESANSSASATVAGAFTLANASAPRVSGPPQAEDTLLADHGTWSGEGEIGYVYQWQRCDEFGGGCEDIEAATGSSYSASAEDSGHGLRVLVTASDEDSVLAESSDSTQPISVPTTPLLASAPLVSGTDREGMTLTATSGTWSGVKPTAYAYQWLRCDESDACSAIAAATSSSYALTRADVDSVLRVRVTAGSRNGTAIGLSAPTAPIDPAGLLNTELPTISGAAEAGATLRLSEGRWTSSGPISYFYGWRRCDASGEACADIEGAGDASYQPQEADVGHTLRATVTARSQWGQATVPSDASAVVTSGSQPAAPEDVTLPTITGDANVGATLKASNGAWSGSAPLHFTYQWEACNAEGAGCVAIEGATGSSYSPLEADAGKALRVNVLASNAAGSESAESAVTETIGVPGPLESVAVPTIAGTAADKHVLTASAGSWSGTRPITYAYQWERCDEEGHACASIEGATSASYAIQTADISDTLRVEVTASNSAGSISATSSAVGPILPSAPFGQAPAISGDPFLGRVLSASGLPAIGTEPIEAAYQWSRCDETGGSCSDIEGATAATYTTTSEDVSATLRVLAKYSNASGTASSESPASALIRDEAPTYLGGLEVEPSSSEVLASGDVLSAHGGSWQGSAPITYGYQWQRCSEAGTECEDIAAATATSYTLVEADEHKVVRLKLTATNATGAASITSASLPVGVAPQLTPGSAPTITGEPVEGVTLSSTTGEWLHEPTEYEYEWRRCGQFELEIKLYESCEPIVGTEATYTLKHADTERKGMVLKVIAVNAYGSTSAWSTPIERVEGPRPVNLTAPTITGTPYVEGTLHAQHGTWEHNRTTFTFQWQLCDEEGNSCADIAGASTQSTSESSYTPPPADIGDTVRVVVTAEGSGSNNFLKVAVASSPTAVLTTGEAPVNHGAPYIAGSAVAGEALEVETGSWEGTPVVNYAFEWERCDAEGESCVPLHVHQQRYSPVAADLEHTLRATVTGSNAAGAESVQTEPTEVVVAGEPPVDITPPDPTWSSPQHAPAIVELQPGTWQGGPSLSDQLERCDPTQLEAETEEPTCSPIVGAMIANNSLEFEPPEYQLEAPDIGYKLRVAETATNAQASTTVYSSLSPLVQPKRIEDTNGLYRGVLAVAGTITADSTVAAEPELPVTTTYEFLRVSGASRTTLQSGTSADYTLVGGDGGHKLEIIMSSAVERADHASTLATRTVTLQTGTAAAAPTASTLPSVTGGSLAGELLTAHMGTWAGGGGTLSYSYEWERCNAEGASCTPIVGAIEQTYRSGPDDVDSELRVKVTAANGGSSGVEHSAATAPIEEALALTEAAIPVIVGEPRDFATLTAETGAWLGSEPVSYTYQWESCGPEDTECFPLEGATDPTYQARWSDVGSTLRVTVTANNGAGPLAATSAVTPEVAPAPAPVNLVPPTLTLLGPPAPGGILLTTEGTWEFVDTMLGESELTFQWQRCEADGSDCSDIPDETTSSYELGEEDSGYRLREIVTAENETARNAIATPLSAVVGEGESSGEGEGEAEGEESVVDGGYKLIYTSGQSVYSANLDGSEAKLLANCLPLDAFEEPDRCSFHHPSISPNGQMIAVELNVGAYPDLFGANPGCEERPICEHSTSDLNRIVLMNADGSEARVIPQHGSEPSWGPATGELTVAEIVENRGVESSTLATIALGTPDAEPHPLPLGPGLISSAAYSPDGEHFAYTVRELGGSKEEGIHVMTPGGPPGPVLSIPQVDPDQLVFTEDGEHLLFVATPNIYRYQGATEPHVYEINIDGTDLHQVSQESADGQYYEDPTPIPGDRLVEIHGSQTIVNFGWGFNIQRSGPVLQTSSIDGGNDRRIENLPGETGITDITSGRIAAVERPNLCRLPYGWGPKSASGSYSSSPGKNYTERNVAAELKGTWQCKPDVRLTGNAKLEVYSAKDTSNVPEAKSALFTGGNGTRLPSLHYKCVAGTRRYKADVGWSAATSGAFEIEAGGATETLPCNAAGAWRIWTEEDSLGKQPSTVLRKQLGPPPAPTGYEAHHIIPAYERNSAAASLLQTEGYACHLFPNGSFNGIYIESVLHRKLHNKRYWLWAAKVLARAIGPNMACPSHDAARYWLGTIKHQISTGVFPGSSG
jgi:fibronectin type 3 domain-containing protein